MFEILGFTGVVYKDVGGDGLCLLIGSCASQTKIITCEDLDLPN